MEDPQSRSPPRSPRATATVHTHARASRPEKPWHHHLTLDLIVLVLSRSVFHPFICFLIPLCLRAQLTPYQHPAFIYTTAWAVVVSLWWVASVVDRRAAYGKPRVVNFGDQQEDGGGVVQGVEEDDEEEDGEGEECSREEVILITGGCSGLGRLLAEIFGLRGLGVAVLDVKEPEGGKERAEEEEGWKWYRCDVGDLEDVQRVKGEVQRDLGKPTILINNAASRIGGLPLCSEIQPTLDPSSIDLTLRTNIHAHFNTLRAFLPDVISTPNGGTIVTISSVLAHLAPANLTDYAASKAAVSALHNSMTMELRQQGLIDRVKTILVETGQIDTELFRDVETPSNFFGPILDTRMVAKEIVKLIDGGEGGLIRMPAYARWIEWYGVLPAGLQRVARWASGIDVAVGKVARDGRSTNGFAAVGSKT